MMPRGNSQAELSKLADRALAEAEMSDVTLFKLLRVFQKVMTRFEESEKSVKIHTVYNFEYTILSQQKWVLSKLKKGKNLAFESLFKKMTTRIEAIVTFLGLLELLNAQLISIIQGEGANNFWLTIYEETKGEVEV